jgi:hypothetical protein
MNNYSVEINGLWLLWYGENNVKNNIKLFLDEASQIFINSDIKYMTNQGYLPM